MTVLEKDRRTDSIRVRLSPDMLDRFAGLAKGYGMPPATLCAFAVAQFVQAEEAKQGQVKNLMASIMGSLQEQIAASTGNVEAGLMDSEAFRNAIAAAGHVALTQPNLPLDDEAPGQVA
jgi:predicted transcriptional regulator